MGKSEKLMYGTIARKIDVTHNGVHLPISKLQYGTFGG